MTDSDEQAIRILVVDDEAIVQSLISDALEEEGYDIETASSGPDALEVIRQHDGLGISHPLLLCRPRPVTLAAS